MIKITSKRHNFRRCGAAHPKGPVEYPDDRFSKDEIKVLKAEPMLTIEIVEEKGLVASTEEELISAAREVIDAGEVTNDGKPKVDAMMAILGCPLTSQDRDAAWEKIQAEDKK